MGSVLYIGGRKVLTPEEIAARRQVLADTRLARLGELADLEKQAADLRAATLRLEGGIIEHEWMLSQMAPPPAEEEEQAGPKEDA